MRARKNRLHAAIFRYILEPPTLEQFPVFIEPITGLRVGENVVINAGRNVWIGTGAIILPGITIGDNAVIGAGSVVTNDVPENTVVAGVPARVIRTL